MKYVAYFFLWLSAIAIVLAFIAGIITEAGTYIVVALALGVVWSACLTSARRKWPRQL